MTTKRNLTRKAGQQFKAHRIMYNPIDKRIKKTCFLIHGIIENINYDLYCLRGIECYFYKPERMEEEKRQYEKDIVRRKEFINNDLVKYLDKQMRLAMKYKEIYLYNMCVMLKEACRKYNVSVNDTMTRFNV